MFKDQDVKEKEREGRVYGTAEEKRFIEKLGVHRLDPDSKTMANRKTNIHKLPADEMDVIIKRIKAQRKRTNWYRARGVMPPRPLTTKASWLRQYIKVSAGREDWGAIDPKEVMKYANKLLKAQITPFPQHTFGV